MAVNTLTRGNTALRVARAVVGKEFYTAAATGGSTTTIVDTKLANNKYPDDYFNLWQVRNQTRDFTTHVTDFVKSTGTFTIPTSTATQSTDTFLVLPPDSWTYDQITDAIDMAVQSTVSHRALLDKVSQAVAYQDGRTFYPLPTDFSYLSRVAVDTRGSYKSNHGSYVWDTLQQVKGAAGNVYVAQSFQVEDGDNPSFVLGDVYLLLGKTGSPTGNLTVTIETDTAGNPTGVAGSVATSATVAVSSVNAEPSYVRFTFTTRPVLTKETTYWIVLTGSYSTSDTACVTWGNDSGGAGYSDGSALIGTSVPAWTALTGDLIFTLRDQQQSRWKDLEPYKHYKLFRDSTRQVEITESGHNFLRSYAKSGTTDGMPFLLEGQGPAALPTADSTTIDIPFNYTVAYASLYLISVNPAWFGKVPGANTMPGLWREMLADIASELTTRVKQGAMQAEVL